MSTFGSKYKINGVVDTNQNVLQNIESIAGAAGSFLSFDQTTGKWGVVTNTDETVSKTFDKDNIIGSINVSGNGITEIYNSVEIEFPHKDLADFRDGLTIEIAAADRYPNEPDNVLTIQTDLINDPIQAEIIGTLELLQSRTDSIIEFRTDFSSLGLLAGDIIEVTDDYLDYTSKKFRVVSIAEVDEDDGNIVLSITAVSFNAANVDVDSFTITRKPRERTTGIKDKQINQEIIDIDNGSFAGAILGSLAVSTIGNFISSVFGLNEETGKAELQLIPSQISVIPQLSITGPNQVCEGESFTLTITPLNTCIVDGSLIPYTITGVDASDIDVDLTGTVEVQDDEATITITVAKDNLTEGTETLVFETSCNSKSVTIVDQYLTTPEYTLTPSASTVDECQDITWTFSATNVDNGQEFTYEITGIDSSDIDAGSLTGSVIADWCDEDGTITISFTPDTDSGDESVVCTVRLGTDIVATNTITLTDGVEYTITASPSSIVEGDSVTFTVDTSSMADGTSVPYVLSGSATSIVTSPSLTGNITINSNTGTLTVQTNDDSIDNATRLLTLTVGPTTNYGSCTGTLTINVTDNDATPPADTDCVYTVVPLVWCGKYDGTSGELKSMSVQHYGRVMTSPALGTGITIPTSVSVSQGSPSTITVTSSVTAYSGNLGGVDLEVITSFDSIATNSAITGTTTTVRGYL